jgi:hypothetical protein
MESDLSFYLGSIQGFIVKKASESEQKSNGIQKQVGKGISTTKDTASGGQSA